MLKGVNEIKFISKSVNANEIPALGQHHMLAPSTDLGQSYNQFGIAPRGVDEALAVAQRLKCPAQIAVRPSGRYTEVVGARF